MLKIYRISTESGEYNFKTKLEGTKLVKESFSRLYEKRLGRSPQFVEIINEGLLDFFKKKKKNYTDKAEQNKVTVANNKEINKNVDKLYKELEDIKNQITKILKTNGSIFNSSDDFKNIKEHILYVGKYLKYASAGLQNALHNKNIKDEDTMNSVAKGIVTVRNMLGGEDYKNAKLSKDELKKAWSLLSKVSQKYRNNEWETYHDFIGKKLGKIEDKTPKLKKQKVENNGTTKLKKTEPKENTNKKESNEEVPVKKKKKQKSCSKEEEECVKGSSCSGSSFKANTTSWF